MVAGERFCGIRSHQAPKVVSLPKRPPGDDRAGARQPFGGKPAGVQWGVFMRPQACAFAGHQTDAPQTLLIPFLVHFSCCQSYRTDTATDFALTRSLGPHRRLSGTVLREWHRLACCASATS